MGALIKAALREPSTWRGIFALLTAIGIMIKPELQDTIIAVGLSFMGAGGLVPDAIGQKAPADPVPDGSENEWGLR